MSKGPLKHGLYGTPAYISWYSMLTRCRNKNREEWKSYGGRGIKVCKRWHKFENFYADMGPRPKGTTLDRIDVNGNYEPKNCRWANDHEQSRNKQTGLKLSESDVLDIFKSKKSTEELSAKFKISQSYVYQIRQGLLWKKVLPKNKIIHKKKNIYDSLCNKNGIVYARWASVTCKNCLKLRPPEPTRRLSRDSLFATAFGETKLIKEWSKIFGVSYHAIKGRIKNGWDHEIAVTKPADIKLNWKNQYGTRKK